jgi:hypothetical protein
MTRPILWQQLAGDTKSRAPSSLGEALQRQFRAIMNALTRPTLAPEPKTRRRKGGDTTRGFMATAGALFRRLVRRTGADILDSHWDAFTWLRIWDYNDLAYRHLYEHSVEENQQFNDKLFPHL